MMTLKFITLYQHTLPQPSVSVGYQGDHMLENYFYDKTGFEQKNEVKREKAVAAVLEILKVSASHSANHVVITSLKNEISEAADAIQKALDKQ
ncbi:TPA: hypothetical protein ACOEGY_000907 [Enterobacter bugandensis]